MYSANKRGDLQDCFAANSKLVYCRCGIASRPFSAYQAYLVLRKSLSTSQGSVYDGAEQINSQSTSGHVRYHFLNIIYVYIVVNILIWRRRKRQCRHLDFKHTSANLPKLSVKCLFRFLLYSQQLFGIAQSSRHRVI